MESDYAAVHREILSHSRFTYAPIDGIIRKQAKTVHGDAAAVDQRRGIRRTETQSQAGGIREHRDSGHMQCCANRYLRSPSNEA